MSKFVHDLGLLSVEARNALDRRPAVWIGGEWVECSTTLPVTDPSSGETVAAIAAGGASEVDAAVCAARAALTTSEWANMGPLSRERLLIRLAELIEAKASALAEIESVDNGMASWFAFGPGVMDAAALYRYYAGWPSKIVGKTMPVEGPPGAGNFTGFTRRGPIGVIGAVIPWNVPFMMAAWKLAPALAAGCTVVLKPAEDTSLSALMLAELIEEAGFPAGVVNIVTGKGSEAGEALVSHPGIDKISFTGSTTTGRRIGEIAGRNLKKHTLELGGKSPVLLFDDANLDAAVPGAAGSIFLNSGQICVAGSRLYVQSGVYDQVLERLASHVGTIAVGAGLAEGTFMGPLVNAAQKARVTGYIENARKDGCEIMTGVAVPDDKGCFVSPTVVAGASDDAQITCEEVFGPVLSVYRFDDEEEALTRANASEYGLSSTIWSQNIDRVMRVSDALQAGKVIVNNPGFPYAGLPEGGWKSSGHGKDLGWDALDGCLSTKTVLMRIGD